MIDNHCGDGRLLVRAAERAVALGFVAVEGRGFDRSAKNIERARAAARGCTLPGVRLVFVRRLRKLPIAADCEADLVLAAPVEDPRDDLDALLGPHGAIVMRTIVPPIGVAL